MKAAIYYGPGDIRIEEIKRPKANPEGVVVKVGACGVCNIMDALYWEAWPAGGIGVGLARGHEWSGEIVEVGSQVTDFKVGDRVYQNPVYRPCYECESCRVKDYWKCINWQRGLSDRAINGAFAEYLWIPFITIESAVKLPDTLSFRDLALIEPLYLAVGLARKAKAGDVVVVLGQDLVGLGTLALLKERGVAKVITSDISQKRLEASREVGADVAVDALNEDVVQVVMKETSGEGADVVIVMDARPITTLQAIGVVRRGGPVWQATMYGVPLVHKSPVATSDTKWIGPNAGYTEPDITFAPTLLSMQTAWGTLGPRVPRWLKATELLQSGKITADKHVTHVFPLDKTKEAFETAMNPHETIKVIVEP